MILSINKDRKQKKELGTTDVVLYKKYMHFFIKSNRENNNEKKEYKGVMFCSLYYFLIFRYYFYDFSSKMFKHLMHYMR